MSQPKHLWSGDWERESQGPPARAAVPQPPAPEPPTTDPVAQDPKPPEHEPALLIPAGWERMAVRGVIALVVVAAAIWGVTAIANRGGGNVAFQGGQNSGVPQQRSARGGNADGLGLVLESLGQSQVVIAGVVPGSAATAIGIGPGLLLLAINGQQVTSAAQANGILRGLKLGTAVTLQLAQGGDVVTAQIQEPGIP